MAVEFNRWMCKGLTLALLAVVAAAAQVGVRADEAQPDAPTPTATRKSPFLPRDSEFEKLRDPFTFFVRRVVRGPNNPSARVEEAKQQAELKYDEARRYFKSLHFKEAEKDCQEGLEKVAEVRNAATNAAQTTELDELIARLTRLKKAANRLFKRQEAQDAMDKLKLEVSGIFSKIHTPEALLSYSVGTGVTTKAVRVGEKIQDTSTTAEQSTDAPTVREIEPGRVVLDFRGYKMELPFTREADAVETLDGL